jgi:hypothetical protein
MIARPSWVKERVLDDSEAVETRPTRSAPKPAAPARKPAPTKRSRPAAPVAASPLPRKKTSAKKERKPRPIREGSVSLGEVEVIRATDMGIQVVGGDTSGENWLPRSYILDPEGDKGLDRDAEVGDRGEVWLPGWLADRVPW